MGAYDSNGIWIYTEDDPASPFSDLLNLLAESASDQFAAAVARVAALEAEGTKTVWNPSFTNVTLGNAAVAAYYTRVGDMVNAMLLYTHGSTSALTGNFQVVAPVQPAVGANGVIGAGFIARGTNQTGRNVVTARMTNSTDFILYRNEGTVNATAPFATSTWTSGDLISVHLAYPAA